MFIIFGGECYYASGGIRDLLGKEDSKETAITLAKELLGKLAITEIVNYDPDEEWTVSHEIEWVHVVDTDTCKIIYESENTPFGINKVLEIRDNILL